MSRVNRQPTGELSISGEGQDKLRQTPQCKVNTLVDTLPKAVADAKAETINSASLTDLKAEALIERGGRRITERHIGVVKANTKVETLHANLFEAEVQTLAKRQKDVKFEALIILHSR